MALRVDTGTGSARWLDWGTRIAIVALAAAFLFYVFGLLDPLIPLDRLPQAWSLPVDRYVALIGAPTGWGWLRLLGKGNYLNFLGVAMLALITLVCYARMVVLRNNSIRRVGVDSSIHRCGMIMA